MMKPQRFAKEKKINYLLLITLQQNYQFVSSAHFISLQRSRTFVKKTP